MTIFWSVALVIGAGSLTPVGEVESTKWGKKKAIGHLLSETGLTFNITGPSAVVLEVRSPKLPKNKAVPLDIIRDEAFVSKNDIKLRRKKGGAKGFPFVGVIGFKVAKGDHVFKIATEGHRLAVRATTVKRLNKRWRASPEREISASPVEPAASAGVESSPPSPPGTVGALAEAAAEAGAAVDAGLAAMASSDDAQPEDPDAVQEVDAAPVADSPADADAHAPAPPRVLERATRIAVYDLEVQGIEASVGTVVTDSLLAEIRKLRGVSSIGMDEIRDMLSHEANKQLLGCESNDACLAELAGALGVDNLITGRLSKAADSHVLMVRRIDQHRAQVAGTVNRRLQEGSGQEFLLAIGPAVEELFPDRPLREGLTRGVPDEVALRLDPPPLPTWTFWTSAGGTALAGAGAAVFALLARNAEADYNRYARQSTTQLLPGDQLVEKGQEMDTYADATNGLWITAAVLAAASGVIYLFTDWEGYGDQP